MKKNSFKDFVIDRLHEVAGVECRAMFGGYGLYGHGVFFGIIYRDRLYFRTDAVTRKNYEQFAMKPFRPNARQTMKSYYEVPPDIFENRERLLSWAKKAIACQKNTRGS